MLRGEKVILRAMRRDDLPVLFEFTNNVEFETLAQGRPWEPQGLERLERGFPRGEYERDGSSFVIEADGRTIGTVSLRDFNATDRTAELGIGIGDTDYQGRGYGRDAVRVILDYAFRLRNLRKVGLWVKGSNERAIKSYLAVGFTEEGRLRDQVWSDGRYEDMVLMGIFPDEIKR